MQQSLVPVEPALAEGKYTAEKLLGRRSRKHVVQYEVKWEGVEETTWVSVQHCQCAQKLFSLEADAWWGCRSRRGT